MTNREMSGIMFRNDEKRSEKSPDYSGTCTIDGAEYRIAGWRKEGKRGPFMSLAFKPMHDERKPEQIAKETVTEDASEGEIPF